MQRQKRRNRENFFFEEATQLGFQQSTLSFSLRPGIHFSCSILYVCTKKIIYQTRVKRKKLRKKNK